MIRIGPSGNSEAFFKAGHKHTYEEPAFLHEIGLNAFEYSFGRGNFMGAEAADKIRIEAEKYDVEISAHAPYFTNFANPDPEMIEKSFRWTSNSILAVKKMGGTRVVVHPGACGKDEREVAMARLLDNVARLAEYLDAGGFDGYKVCLETLGKKRQLGTVEEVLAMCKRHPLFYPCFDFGHINSYTGGGLQTVDDYKRIIDLCAAELGDEKTKHMHVHFSKIEYGASGEIRHLRFSTDPGFGPDYEPLARVIDEYRLTPFIVCESDGTMSDDALIMKKCHQNVSLFDKSVL